MPYYTTERGAPWSPGGSAQPDLSPVPPPRGAWVRPDPDYPGHVIVEMWTGDGQRVAWGRMTAAYYEYRRNAITAELDAFDPVHRYIKAI